ncbi:MFS transporter [Streptomyces atratus]|uniref:MFS transporter n=1 Tax=Streptomyces atratus TaxID=1893 RepID=UPI0035710FB9
MPVPFVLAWGPSWWWVLAANVLLGVNQGMTWSMTVNMKIDLVGSARRGLATGLNEAAGYVAVGTTALLTGYLAASHGLRPAPEAIGVFFVAAGFGLSFLVRDTSAHVALEPPRTPPARAPKERARHSPQCSRAHRGALDHGTTGPVTLAGRSHSYPEGRTRPADPGIRLRHRPSRSKHPGAFGEQLGRRDGLAAPEGLPAWPRPVGRTPVGEPCGRPRRHRPRGGPLPRSADRGKRSRPCARPMAAHRTVCGHHCLQTRPFGGVPVRGVRGIR